MAEGPRRRLQLVSAMLIGLVFVLVVQFVVQVLLELEVHSQAG